MKERTHPDAAGAAHAARCRPPARASATAGGAGGRARAFRAKGAVSARAPAVSARGAAAPECGPGARTCRGGFPGRSIFTTVFSAFRLSTAGGPGQGIRSAGGI